MLSFILKIAYYSVLTHVQMCAAHDPMHLLNWQIFWQFWLNFNQLQAPAVVNHVWN